MSRTSILIAKILAVILLAVLLTSAALSPRWAARPEDVRVAAPTPLPTAEPTPEPTPTLSPTPEPTASPAEPPTNCGPAANGCAGRPAGVRRLRHRARFGRWDRLRRARLGHRYGFRFGVAGQAAVRGRLRHGSASVVPSVASVSA